MGETGVFTFMALDDRGDERLLIFGVDAGSKTSDSGRLAAERMVNEMVQEKLKGGDRGRSDSRPARRKDSRPRARSPPRRRADSRQPPPAARRNPPARRDSRDRGRDRR